MELDFRYEKYDKTVKTKNFKVYYDRYLKKVDAGREELIAFFESNIIPVADTVFNKRANVFFYIINEAKDKGYLLKKDRDNLINLLFQRVRGDKPEVSIDFERFFSDINKYIAQIIIDIDKNSTLAFFATPMLFSSHVKNCIDMKYSDIRLVSVERALVMFYNDSKGQRKVIIDENIARSYQMIYDALIKKFGQDDFVFPVTKEPSWTISKIGKLLYNSYLPYVTDSEKIVKDTTFITMLKRGLKNDSLSNYKEV